MPGSYETRFAADHPTGPGHFPGNPIIPGALILDVVVAAIAGSGQAARGCEIRAVKFLRPIRPGDDIRIEWHEERGETRFQCALIQSDEIALTGTLRFGSKP